MKVITLRNLPPRLLRIIRRRAGEKRMSHTKAVVTLLEEHTGLRGPKPVRPLSHDLDALAGSWTRHEAEVFEKGLARQRAVDQEMWT